MKKTLTVEQVLELEDAVNSLYGEHFKYQINVAYRLYLLKKELNELCDYIINHITEVIPSLKDEHVELNESEKLAYQTILNSQVEIETFNLTRAEIYFANQSVTLDKPCVELELLQRLELLF